MLAGLLALYYAGVMKNTGAGSRVYSERYGGDAYTGIQNAAADTANNLVDLIKTEQKGFGALLAVAGLALCAGGAGDLAEAFAARKKPEDGRERPAAPSREKTVPEDDEPEDDALYEVICPVCGRKTWLDETELGKGAVKCRGCGELLEFDFGEESEEEKNEAT